MNSQNQNPSLDELKAVRWTRKGPFQGSVAFPDTVPRKAIANYPQQPIHLKLGNSELFYDGNEWSDLSLPGHTETTANPTLSRNITLKKRKEALIRTAAVSQIEIEQMKEDIEEARDILLQLAQS